MRNTKIFERSSRWAALFLLSAIALGGAIATAIAYPQPMFFHSVKVGQFQFYADTEMDLHDVEQVVARTVSRLEKSELFDAEVNLSVFIVPNSWKRQLLFLPAANAGGAVYYPLARRNIYLSEVDFEKDRLIFSDGYSPDGNRTLSYFLAHEAAHIFTGNVVGVLGLFQLPVWLREGYADLVGMGFPDDMEILKSAVDRDIVWGRDELNQFGFYGSYRLQVELALAANNNDIHALFGQIMDQSFAPIPLQE